MNIYYKRWFVFITVIVLLIIMMILAMKPREAIYKVRYFNKPIAKIRPKIFLNNDKKIADLVQGSVDKNKIRINIEKSKYKLTVLYKNKPIKSYPIVLGWDPVNDKRQEGDGRTPEGTFKVKMVYPHNSWSKFIWLDYPNKASWRKFNKAKTTGEIEEDATIGGEIGIHGVPERDDKLIDQGINWTAGCISLKREDVDEIYQVIQKGTNVIIG